MAIDVMLLPHASTPNPLRTLYGAYRVAYSALTPREIQERIDNDHITEEVMLDFINKRLETGHASPLQQVTFGFGISGVSRAFSHQFVRHHMGIDHEQQSQRYVSYEDKTFPYTTPPTIEKAHYGDAYRGMMASAQVAYDAMSAAGVPGEDARFILPNATNTNFQVTVNFLELQHIADLRLCTRAQWEFRNVVSRMRAEVKRVYPWLGAQLGPKCMAFRQGYCDESFADWQKCPLASIRPHKSQVIPA